MGQIFDTSNFYIAFQEGDEIRFELEVEDGRILPKRVRKVQKAFTEYVIQSGQPLLIRSELEKTRARLGITYVPDRPAKSLVAAPILLGNKPAGVMFAMSKDRETVFEQRDLDVLVTAAGQLSVAVENARLFAEEQRRLAAEDLVHRLDRNPRLGRDGGQRGGRVAGLDEQGRGRVQDRPAPE